MKWWVELIVNSIVKIITALIVAWVLATFGKQVAIELSQAKKESDGTMQAVRRENETLQAFPGFTPWLPPPAPWAALPSEKKPGP